MTVALEVREMALSALPPAPYNPRKISKKAARGLRASVKRFGLVQPIVWNERTRHVVGGHQRIDALRELGRDAAQVVVVDLPESEEKALNVTLNNPAIGGEFSAGIGDVIAELRASLEAPVFEELQLGELESPRDVVEDEVPEPPKIPVTKPGDLWTLGRHRLLCGDNRAEGSVESATNRVEIALLLTDPPYGIGIVKGVGKIGGFGRVWQDRKTPGPPIESGGNPIRARAGKYLPIRGDEAPFDPSPLLALGREQIIFGAQNFASRLPDNRCWIVWDKENGAGSFGDAELAWASHDRAIKLYRHKWNGLVRAGSRAVEGVRRLHPTQKPVGLLGAILSDFSSLGDTILDPFLGSGTTLIAAEQLDRTCYGLEIEPRYCDVIVERWQNLAGKKATRA